SSIYIGTQQNVGLGGPPPLIAPQPGPDNPPPGTAPAGAPPGTVPGVPRSTANPEPGVPPTNFPAPPGTSPVPTLVTPLPGNPPPPPATTPGGAPPVTTPGGVAPVTQPPGGVAAPTTPPRDVSTTPPAAPGAAPAAATTAQVIVTPPGTEFRVAGGPYTVPVSINNVARLSVMTLTVTYNPNVLRVRTAQDGTFMRQGGVATSFTPRIDAAAGRIDIAITRTADQAGASGTGLLTALIFDAIGPGGSVIQVSGVASTPEGAAINLQFTPVNVMVR
ncbi:MAG TPA: cohesin domain-containing protein, partial [Vicinamibacterales bacterium]|nr:cohesin domain-containing protein [Vicinamibacterales bacterium]